MGVSISIVPFLFIFVGYVYCPLLQTTQLFETPLSVAESLRLAAGNMNGCAGGFAASPLRETFHNRNGDFETSHGIDLIVRTVKFMTVLRFARYRHYQCPLIIGYSFRQTGDSFVAFHNPIL